MKRREFIAALAGAAACPLAARAQQQPAGKTYRLAYLALLSGEDTTLVKPLLQRLRELGYAEGRNLVFEYRSAEDRAERLPQLAGQLLQANPDVLVAGWGTLAAKAAKAATATVPVVFTSVGDPLGAELIASLARPGANVTGLTSQAKDIVGKRFQLLQELVPADRMIAVLLNPDTPFSSLTLQELRAVAGDRRFEVFEVRTAGEVATGVEVAIRSGAAGLLPSEDFLILSHSRQIAELAAKARLPTIFGSRDLADAGGLMSYGTERRQLWRRAAEYVDKILQGARPGNIPVEQPTKFELVINLKTANALGIAVPPSLLTLADEVIE
jgi:putative ABC transport system substrate-binding protein